ncbi:rhodanese-like domain-containing protein [Mameliella alba]|nr:rhodanese-like domain-containing protein [Antarctobacter heliothermus]MBY6142562.1 rhodanese-like domain-containing protein [Mameliella alba]MBY6159390.1 rhodanese-like domain-containing protein [Mameliella alba]MBY6167861.1 rhodanese-like domain-containing protein [Mameliella alba]MBY6172882.1 rhodanese-like domain-containing protein [Mameliella alba]
MSRRVLFGTVAAATATSAYALFGRATPTKAVSQDRFADDLKPRTGRLLVDIREPLEWQQTGVLIGARLHSWRSAENFVAALADEIARADEILLLCRSGNRSSSAARSLADHLDREIIDVAGGMIRLAHEGKAQVVAPTKAMGCTVC